MTLSVTINSLKLATGNVTNTKHTWRTIPLPYKYREMVVIATPQYWDEKLPAVVRIRNASGSSFQMRVENPSGADLEGYTVQYMVVEAGIYRHSDGAIKIEARRVESALTAGSGNWKTQQYIAYRQAYNDPIVLGQVMTSNDRWSSFWAHGDGGVDSAPNSNSIFVGKHVGEDPEPDRQNETLGVVIFEAGNYQINGIDIQAIRSPNNVIGRSDADVVPQPLPGVKGITAVASSAGMNGADGAWPVLWGDTRTKPFAANSLALAMDEDQLQNEEQAHIAEEINFVVLNASADVARFMAQASLGGDQGYIEFVARTGYPFWLRSQKNSIRSLTKPFMVALDIEQAAEDPASDPRDFPYHFTSTRRPSANNFSTIWMRNIVNNPDYLRQRVTWTLSQIFVVSYRSSALATSGVGLGEYYDILSEHALGNFRDLLYEVTMNGAMAYYLSSLGNEKANPALNRYPDENYAREVMQLFTIGLWELNIDGTLKMADPNGRPCDPTLVDSRKMEVPCEPIPTYDNEDIQELARVFTGLWFEGNRFKLYEGVGLKGNVGFKPLVMFEDEHDQDAKVLFRDKPHETQLPANNGGIQDINDALDVLFNHPNVPPFISGRLIQFLVTSNPSRAYVRRIAQVFKDNGNGVRGDLHAVVMAILLDQEARYYRDGFDEKGKLMEPMLRLTRMVKAFRAGRGVEDFQFWEFESTSDEFAQWPLYSATVFNFFEPDYSHVGPLRDAGLASPEFQILNPVTATTAPNELIRMIDNKIHRITRGTPPDFKFNFATELTLVNDVPALVERLNLLLCYGRMSEQTRAVIVNGVEQVTNSDPDVQASRRVYLAVWLTTISPDAAILR